MVRPSTVTASDSGLSREPLHPEQGTSRMYPSIWARTASESDSLWRRWR